MSVCKRIYLSPRYLILLAKILSEHNVNIAVLPEGNMCDFLNEIKDLYLKKTDPKLLNEFLKEETFIVRRGESLLRRRVISGNNLESD